MARKAAKNQPPLIPDAVEVAPAVRLRPLPASVGALFLPDLVDEAVRNMHFEAYRERRENAHAVYLQWIDKLRSGLLRDLTETQIEQDFTGYLLKALGYSSVGAVLVSESWSMQPKWPIANVGQADIILGRVTHDAATGVSADILAVGELKGAKIDLDRKDATGRSPVQQAFDYLNGCPSARWALVTNYAEFRLYHRDRGTTAVHRVALEDLADPAEFARFFAVFHADSLLSESTLPYNAARLLRETAERQEKVGRDLYDHYTQQRFRLIQILQSEHGLDLDSAIARAQKLLDRVLFVAFADDRRLLDDRRVLEKTSALKVPMRSAWNNFQALFRAFDEGDPRSGITRFDGSLFEKDDLLDAHDFHLDDSWPQVFESIGKFDFKNEVSVEVLGRIFERSITDLEKLKAAGPGEYEAQARDRKSPGRRKREGVYYTDKPIVDYLVAAALNPQWNARKAALDHEHGIDPLSADHPPAAHTRALLAWLDDLTVCDPACGSGAFLIGAYAWFEDRRLGLLDALDSVEPDAPECAGGRDDWRARSAEHILRHNLHGVDLAGESIEIARLSLWIQTARRGQPLTELRHNIVQGNSVVDDSALDPHAFDWRAAFPEVFARGGFDAVIGNPPYVRQERLGPIKDHLKTRFAAYHGMADLYVYFYERGLDILKPDGRLAFVVTNKWMKAGYGEPLRALLSSAARVEQLIDFGHAKQFFPDADVFPCFLVARKLYLPPSPSGEGRGEGSSDPASVELPDKSPERERRVPPASAWRQPHEDISPQPQPADAGRSPDPSSIPHSEFRNPHSERSNTALVCVIPRDLVKLDALPALVAGHAIQVEHDRFGPAAWNLEPKAVADLMAKIRAQGIPLKDYTGTKPYRGILTGFNEAFLIDTPTRDALIHADPKSAEIIKPYLRGQDIKRWVPEWAGLWMIALKSSGDHPWPWADHGDKAEATFARAYPSLHAHLKPFEKPLRTRQDKGRHWWELRACAYWEEFNAPKLIYQDITWSGKFSFDHRSSLSNNTTYFIRQPTTWLAATLNSPLLWWFMSRAAQHGKDEALRLFSDFVETIPIAPSMSGTSDVIDDTIRQLVAITGEYRARYGELSDWLQVQFGVSLQPDQLSNLKDGSSDGFVAEVQKRRSTSSGLSSAALKSLRAEYTRTIEPARLLAAEALQLEYRLHDLVNAAYNLTPDEVKLLWDTAPPRMPIPRPPGA